MTTVLAVAYGGGHIACLLPVIERLRARGDRVEILALTTAAAVCADRGIPFRRIVDFPAIQDGRSRAHGERLAAAQPAHAAVSREETVAYLGASYRDLEDDLGAEGAARRFAEAGRQAFLPVGSLAGIIAAVRPDALLTTSAPRAERAAVLAARRLGVPAAVVVDLFALSEDAWLADPAFGDAICVLGPSVREHLIAKGRPAADVIVTGNPVFDRLGDPALMERGRALRAERGWDGCRVVTWASQPEPSDPELPRRIEAALTAALASRPSWRLVIRRHPSEQVPPPPPHPQVVHSTRADDLHVLLAASDAVVTMTSTVGLEAAILGKPLVTYDRSENTHLCPYAAMGLSLGSQTVDALPDTIDSALSGAAPLPPLPPVGGGAAGVVAVLDRLMRR